MLPRGYARTGHDAPVIDGEHYGDDHPVNRVP